MNTNIYDSLITYLTLHQYAYVAAIIAATIVVALLVEGLLRLGLYLVIKHNNAYVNADVLRGLQSPLFYGVLIGGVLAIGSIQDFMEVSGVSLIPLFKTILLILGGVFIYRFSQVVLSIAAQVRRVTFVKSQTLPLFLNLAWILILVGTSYSVLSEWGVDTTAWLASAGVVGIAVGFAAKDTLANLISGFFILSDASYRIGDYVVLDSGERGEVRRVGLRSTRLLTRDDVEIIVPNALMGNTKVVNESRGSAGGRRNMRIRIPVGVAYGTKPEIVEKLLLAAAEGEELVREEPAPRVRMRAFGTSSIDFELLCWVSAPPDRGLVSHKLHLAIYESFLKAKIEIPYAKQDLYIKEMPK